MTEWGGSYWIGGDYWIGGVGESGPVDYSVDSFLVDVAFIHIGAFTDNLVEGDETVVLTLMSGDGYTVDPEHSTFVYTIHDATPVAVDDFYSGDVNEMIEGNVLDNDTDPQDHSLTTSVVTDVSHGTLNLNYDGSFDYTPDTDWSGIDSFVYEAANGHDSTNEATVWLSVGPVVSVFATRDATEGGESGIFQFVRGADLGSSLTANYSIGTEVGAATPDTDYTALTGSVYFAVYSDTAYVYVASLPDGVYDNGETVTVTVTSGTGYDPSSHDTATIGIIDATPIAVDDVYLGDVNEEIEGNVLDNDSDPQNLSLSADLVTDVSNGTLNLNEDGSFDYTPDTDYIGVDSFVYEVSNGGYGTNQATVWLYVGPHITIEKIDDATEGGSNGLFRFTRTDDTSEELTVNFVVSGNALPDADYVRLDGTTELDPWHGTITFAENSDTADLDLTTIDDSAVESAETVVVTLATGTGYHVGTQKKATAHLFDDDAAARLVEVSYDVAAEQTLAASAGVGLLANYELDGFDPEKTITSIEIFGDTTYDPEDEIAVTGWGTLTVAEDGSFSFVSTASTPGVLVFRFDFTDGITSGYGIAALWVGGSGVEYEEEELETASASTMYAFTAAPAGTMTFTRERDTSHDTHISDVFTIHDARFHRGIMGLNGPFGVAYAIMGLELNQVDVVSTLQLPASEAPVELHSELYWFTFSDGQELATHIAEVRKLVDIAIEDIALALGPDYATSAMKGQIDRWFKGKGEGAPSDAPTQVQVGTIKGVFGRVASLLDNEIIGYEAERGVAGYGWNYGNGWIGIRDDYFTGTARDRFGTVIHELAHSVHAGDNPDVVTDNAYFSTADPDSLDPNNPNVQWEHIVTHAIITPTTAELIDNADSYAGFLTQNYYQ